MIADPTWAFSELSRFLRLTELQRPSESSGVISTRLSNRGDQPQIVAAAQVVEQILDRVLPGWQTTVPNDRNRRVNRWCQHIEAAQRAQVALQRQAEVREKLGDDAPRLNAARLHPWVWESARSLWQSGHFADAVRTACVKVNAETQNKVGRRDVSETSLFNEVFTTKAPEPGKPRLRRAPDDGSPTYESLHRGARAFAEGIYAGIRNPLSHTNSELTDDEALEHLAALSILARWVDDAMTVVAP